MKVLQINSVCGIGSTGRIAADLYHVLKEQGHECKIAYGRDVVKNVPVEDTMKIGSIFDVKAHALLTRLTDKTGFYSKRATIELIKKIDEYNPDIVQLHNLHGYYINIEILFNYLSKANKTVVWTLHDCWAFTGHCSHFDFEGCNKWKTECSKCSLKKQYPSSMFFDNSYFNFQKKKELFTSINNMIIVTPSKWLAGLVQESFLNKYEVKVIPNGIDLSVFKPTESDFRKNYGLTDKFIILGVASIWSERKGFEDFIKLSKMIDEKYKIVLVGLKQKQIKMLPENIIGICKTNSIQELAQIYTSADVFVNLSIEETMGLVTVEALACGTPTIVYKATAIYEVIDCNCGIIVEKCNLIGILKAIDKLSENNFDNSACINRSKMFNKSILFDEYIKMYSVLREV